MGRVCEEMEEETDGKRRRRRRRRGHMNDTLMMSGTSYNLVLKHNLNERQKR